MGFPASLTAAAAAVAVAFAGFVAVSACQEATQITLEITTDVPCAELGGTSISVSSPERAEKIPPAATTKECKAGRVGALVVVPSGSPDELVGIRIVSSIGRSLDDCANPTRGDQCIVARRALRFVRNVGLELPVRMSQSCAGVPCDEDETCVDGACRPALIADPGACPGGVCSDDLLAPAANAGAGPSADASAPANAFAPADASALADAGCIADLDTDPKNCGACGHDCLGGTCTNRACDPAPLVSGQVTPTGVLAVGGKLFWTDQGAGRVRTCNPDDCVNTTQDFAVNQPIPARIVGDAQGVYWINYASGGGKSGGGIAGCPLTGCVNAAPTFSVAAAWVGSIWLDATNVYYAAEGAGTKYLAVCARTGCTTPTDLGSSIGITANLAADATYVYWTIYDILPLGGVLRCPKAGCGGSSPQRIDTSANASGFAMTNSDLFWTSEVASGSVYRLSKNGGPREVLASGQGGPREIIVDGAYVYWTNRAAGTVMRCAQTGCNGAPTVLASGQKGPWFLTADSRAIYWTNRDGDTIMRIAK